VTLFNAFSVIALFWVSKKAVFKKAAEFKKKILSSRPIFFVPENKFVS
jgi:uncharacterized membrane protein